MNLDADFFAAAGALAAVPISMFAAYLAKRADARSKIAARTQVYLSLRSRFIEVHQQLPPSYADNTWRPTTEAEKGAVARYWHHAFDEWYVTTHLDHELLSSLWQDFFSGAVLSGMRHSGLRLHFATLQGNRGEHDTMWNQFSQVLEFEWRATHKSGDTKCDGFHCQQSHEA
jgi:hypothetical protein